MTVVGKLQPLLTDKRLDDVVDFLIEKFPGSRARLQRVINHEPQWPWLRKPTNISLYNLHETMCYNEVYNKDSDKEDNGLEINSHEPEIDTNNRSKLKFYSKLAKYGSPGKYTQHRVFLLEGTLHICDLKCSLGIFKNPKAAVDAIAQEIEETITNDNDDTTFTVLGLSMGGMLAARVCALLEERSLRNQKKLMPQALVAYNPLITIGTPLPKQVPTTIVRVEYDAVSIMANVSCKLAPPNVSIVQLSRPQDCPNNSWFGRSHECVKQALETAIENDIDLDPLQAGGAFSKAGGDTHLCFFDPDYVIAALESEHKGGSHWSDSGSSAFVVTLAGSVVLAASALAGAMARL